MGNQKNGKKSKFAGMVAAPLADKREALDLRIAVKSEDLDMLDATAASVIEAAERVEAAAKVAVSPVDVNQKQLHRRVIVLVYDSEGTRISHGTHDLTAGDKLTVNVDSIDVRATVGSTER